MTKLIPIGYSNDNIFLYYILIYKDKKVCKGHINFNTEYFNIDRIYCKGAWSNVFIKKVLNLDYRINKKSLKKLYNMYDKVKYKEYLRIFCRN